MRKVELLAPAGDLEKLKIAYLYGADACFIGGKEFSLRARASNFSLADIKEGAKIAHMLNKKLYVTTNIVPHHENYEGLLEYLKELEKASVDGIIVASPYIAKVAKDHTNLEVHVSTQQSVLNTYHLNFWEDLGASGVVLGRELDYEQILKITAISGLDIEVFIHGGMCSSYSGRCTLSNTFTLRDANRGGCAHSCRWDYNLYDGEEKISTKIPFSMGSKDMQTLREIPKIIDCNVNSLKIEGRMKSLHYIATVVKTYRMLIDEYLGTGKVKDFSIYEEEIMKAESRITNTGFFNKENINDLQLYSEGDERPSQLFVGLVLDGSTDLALVEQRNYFEVGDKLELFSPLGENKTFILKEMFDEEKKPLKVARHPQQKVYLKIPYKVNEYDMLRKVYAETYKE
jgi:putative protease